MKVLIIGAAGFLGKELLRDFSKGNAVSAADKYEGREGLYYIDLCKKDVIKEVFLQVKPQVVLLTASVTAVDFCEQHQDLAWGVNVEGPKEICLSSKRHGAFLVFYSSDYVFDGAGGPYSEEAQPNPLNFYGKTKLEAEKIIQRELKEFLIIRTCGLYGYEKDGKNFAMQVIGNLHEKKRMRVPIDQFGTPTYVEDLSNLTVKLVGNKKEGIFNVVGPDYLNRLQLGHKIAEVFGLDKGLIEGVATESLNQPAPRPRKGGLKIDKLKRELGVATRSLAQGLAAMKSNVAP